MSEMKLYGQGEMHLRVTTERLADRFGVTINTQKPTVAYRETIRDAVTVRGRHKKQSGGHGQFGDVVVEVGPRGRGEGFAFAERVHGGTVPQAIFLFGRSGREGRAGARAARLSRRRRLGHADSTAPITRSIRRTWRSAPRPGSRSTRRWPRRGPVLLEPILSVTIYVPSDALARASALVSARRGQILGFEAREGWEGWEALRALIPEAEIGDLIVELRSATAGVGAFETKFDHLAELSGRTADQVIASAGSARRRELPREPETPFSRLYRRAVIA